MSSKDFLTAILALLAILATAFVSIRGDIADLTKLVYTNQTNILWIKQALK